MRSRFLLRGLTGAILLSLLASIASAAPLLWYKGIGTDGKQPGERGMPDFLWVANCFATSAYNSIYWFWLHGRNDLIPGGTSWTEDINKLYNDYMGGANANHGSMFSGMLKWMNDPAGQDYSGTYRGVQDSANSIDQRWLRGGAFGFPTWDFYRAELKRCEDVILLIDWEDPANPGKRKGHAITGAGVGNSAAGEDLNAIAVSDPSDGSSAGHNPDPNSWAGYKLTVGADGALYIPNYALAGGGNARIYGMFAVSPVPEPAVWVLVGAGLIGIGIIRRRCG
jgi:hypothetical protein